LRFCRDATIDFTPPIRFATPPLPPQIAISFITDFHYAADAIF
jgi:hypothetical protein